MPGNQSTYKITSHKRLVSRNQNRLDKHGMKRAGDGLTHRHMHECMLGCVYTQHVIFAIEENDNFGAYITMDIFPQNMSVLLFIGYFSFDGNFQMGEEFVKLSIAKLNLSIRILRNMPASDNFPCRIYPVRLVAVDKN